MTVKQVAEFYEAGIRATQSVYEDHRHELELDGAQLVKQSVALNTLEGNLKSQRGKVIVIAKEENKITRLKAAGTNPTVFS